HQAKAPRQRYKASRLRELATRPFKVCATLATGPKRLAAMQQQSEQQTALSAGQNNSEVEPEFAYKILQWSVAKIGDSRRRKGGVDLRQNLLLANTLCKARDSLLAAKMQQQQARQLEQQQMQQLEQQKLEQQQMEQQKLEQQQMEQQKLEQQKLEQQNLEQHQQRQQRQRQQQQLRRQKLKRSASIAIDNEAAGSEPGKRPYLEHGTQQQQQQQQVTDQASSIGISIIPLSPAEAARLSRSQPVVSLSLSLGGQQQQQQPLISWTALSEPVHGGCVLTCA
ncbi:hypothetical protein BOX15_Mlig006748g1, partial [Macrostomum lignano]